MADPFDTLRRHDPDAMPVDRLPAAEVRRRGDARRRRRTALQGAAAVLAVVAVVGGVSLATGAPTPTLPQPAPARVPTATNRGGGQPVHGHRVGVVPAEGVEGVSHGRHLRSGR